MFRNFLNIANRQKVTFDYADSLFCLIKNKYLINTGYLLLSVNLSRGFSVTSMSTKHDVVTAG